MREALERAAAGAGLSVVRGLRTTAATDAIVALRAGYRVATLASVDETKLPDELPLAVRHTGGAALGDDRGRDRGVRAVPARASRTGARIPG